MFQLLISKTQTQMIEKIKQQITELKSCANNSIQLIANEAKDIFAWR